MTNSMKYYNYSLIISTPFNNPEIYVFLEMLYKLYENVVYFIEELERRENGNKIQLPSSKFEPLDSLREGETRVGHFVQVSLFNQL